MRDGQLAWVGPHWGGGNDQGIALLRDGGRFVSCGLPKPAPAGRLDETSYDTRHALSGVFERACIWLGLFYFHFGLGG